ncbi:MAG TPA: 5-formyltetrahydrofolate cyclo-ligase [Fibrobacteres bacterium]|nr:5-formyltetrahydrofolate cyclo-ligase [Fibrobacterota bacterium]
MNMGLGMSEIIVIAVVALLLFGPKELPRVLRDAARMFAKLKLYTDKIKKELDETLKINGTDSYMANDTQKKIKQTLRLHYRSILGSLSPEEIKDKSGAIWKNYLETPEYKTSKAIMIYVSIGSEVVTREYIIRMLHDKKRVIIPYCKNALTEIGIAEIQDIEKDVTDGTFGILEPVEGLRNNFFKSDLQLVICPAIAFDIYGGRLGRGKGYYDIFLKELKGKARIFGFGYDCQIHRQNLPFDYHDIPMDQIITESGLLLKSK